MSILKKLRFIINALIKRGYWYNNILFQDCQKFCRYNKFNTSIVNLGSTSALYAFNYDGTDLVAANWALSRNPLTGDCAILKNYYSFLDAKASTVILPLCPFTTLAGSYTIHEDRYYSILYPTTIPGYNYMHESQVLKAKEDPVKIYPIYGLFLDVKYLFCRPQASTVCDFEKDANKWLANWKHEFSIKDFNAPLSLHNNDSIEDALKCIREIINFCNNRNIRLIITIPPMHYSLQSKLNDFIERYVVDKIEPLCISSGVTFLNYGNNDRLCNDSSLYLNSFLLNTKGAQLFTNQIIQDIGLV